MADGLALEIIVPPQFPKLAAELADLSEDTVQTRGSGFGGIDASSVIFLALSVPLIKSVSDVLISRIRAGQTTKLRYKGMIMEGVSEETILKALDSVKDDLEP